jgi:hypothetical protein
MPRYNREGIRKEADIIGINPEDCAHTAFEPELYLGTLTSEFVCVLCGRSFSYEHARYILEKGNAARIPSETQTLAHYYHRKIGEARLAP